MVLDRFFNSRTNDNEPPSKFRQLDKDVQKEMQEQQEREREAFFGRGGHDPFANFFGGGGQDPFEAMMRQHPFFNNRAGSSSSGMMMQRSGYQVKETKDQFSLSMDIPGVEAKDLTLKLVDDAILCLTGTRKQQPQHYCDEPGRENNRRSNRSMESRFQQCFTVSGPVDASRVTADLSNGVLHVEAPKIQQIKKEPIDIPITEGNNGRPKL